MQLDPYRPPVATVVDEKPRGRKLYSLNQIAIATLIGSVAAGCFLMAQNFAALGHHSARLRTLGWGVLAALALIGIFQLLPDIPGLSVGINIASLVVVRAVAQDMQGDDIQARLSRGGALHSIWWALLVSVVFVLGFLAALFLGAFAFFSWSRLPG